MSELVSQAKIELSFCNNLPLIESHGCGGQASLYVVTPGFKDKTECIAICMPGSSFIHIEKL